MLKVLLASSLLLGACAIYAVASGDERHETREGNHYESRERYAGHETYRDTDSRYHGQTYRDREERGSYTPGKRSVHNDLYARECGSCHFAYQPELLPKRSWVRMMGSLQNHFGSDASLAEEERLSIEKYLVQHAGDTGGANLGHYRKINRSIAPDEAPQRISETRYFVKEHREIPQRLIAQKEVKSLSNCIACHKTADKGLYNERDIFIPNHGRWED